MDSNVSMLLTALLVVIGSAVLAGFFYWRRQLNDTRLAWIVDRLVEWAEHEWGNIPGPERQRKVVAYIKQRLPWVDEEFAIMLIKSAVLRLDPTKPKQAKQPDAPRQMAEWRGRRD